MYKKILVPLDGNPGAEYVIDWATALARGSGADVELLSVVELDEARLPPPPSGGGYAAAPTASSMASPAMSATSGAGDLSPGAANESAVKATEEVAGSIEQARQQFYDYLSGQAERLSASGLTVAKQVLQGHPVDEITTQDSHAGSEPVGGITTQDSHAGSEPA